MENLLLIWNSDDVEIGEKLFFAKGMYLNECIVIRASEIKHVAIGSVQQDDPDEDRDFTKIKHKEPYMEIAFFDAKYNPILRTFFTDINDAIFYVSKENEDQYPNWFYGPHLDDLRKSHLFQELQHFLSNQYPMRANVDENGIYFEYLDKKD